MRITRRIQAAQRAPVLQVAKTAIATVAAWLIAGWLIPGPLPVFAAIAALLVVQPSVNQSFGKALERSIGVIVGVAIATGISLLFGQNSWIVLLAIVLALFTAWLAKMTPPTGNQVAISAMLVLALGASSPEYALDRVLETLIGAAIGLIVNALIVPPVLVAPARRDIALLGEELAASLDRLAAALESEQAPARLQQLMIEARLLRPMTDAASESIAAGEDSLAFNPRRSQRAELAALRELLERFRPITVQLIGMTRAFADHYDAALHTEPSVRAIAEQLRRSAHDVRLLVRTGDRPGAKGGAEPPPLTSELPALTAPLVIAAPRGGHWILIGSLMEDLRRIHEGLVEDPV